MARGKVIHNLEVENVPAPKQFTYAIDETKCKNCVLWETSTAGHVRRSGVYGRGTGKSALWIYGEDLRNEDVKQGLPIVGDAGKLLSRLLNEVGLSEGDCFITNVVRCRPPSDRAPYAIEYKACMETHAKLDVPATPPKLILLLGALPLKVVLNKQKITENRGILFDCPMFECKDLATYHPGKVFYDPNEYDTVKADFQKARDFILENQTAELPKIHKEFICSKERFLSWMKILANSEIKERYADIETTGLSFFNNEISSMAFTTEIAGELYGIGFLLKPPLEWAMKYVWEKTVADQKALGIETFSIPEPEIVLEAKKKADAYWYADLNDPDIRAALQEVLNYPIDFHRGLFDVPWFWHRGLDLNFGIDTMDMHVLINENSTHGLKFLLTIYNSEAAGYQLKILEEMGDTGNHCEAAPENLIDYNIDDTYHGFILKKKFFPMMEKEGMTNFFHTLQMPLERTLTKMSLSRFYDGPWRHHRSIQKVSRTDNP